MTRPEVAALTSLDLSARPALDNARALFLLGVYTGLRFSDVAALRPEHILPDRLRLTTQKTRDTLTVPIRPEARALLARHGWYPAPVTQPSAQSPPKRVGGAGRYRYTH